MTFSPSDIVNRLGQLASLPETVLRLNEMLDDPNSTTGQMETVINQDPGLVTHLLSIANSPLFAQNAQVDSISRAIMIMGINPLRDIILATSCVETFAGLSNKHVNMRDFWEHSLYTGIVARTLASKRKLFNKERLFLMGLLHDIGELALYQVAGEEMDVVMERVVHGKESVVGAEHKVFGFDHTDVGAEMLRQWRMPESLSSVIKAHHEPWKADQYSVESGIVHLADNIAKMAGHSQGSFDSETQIELKAWKITGLSEKIIDSVIQVADTDFAEAKTIMFNKKWAQSVA